ncbi:uncharacterized protein LOC101858663 [Aplysia californica]|uniref:Uncharacterized protein LOC101858663 n=1 Tax=Aplysia californica TaxID=6500 RepID=A0ABM0K1W9_APLCA|nr:uncharacterized protein LOC101858663 [Aplysia californica]XP_005106800.1 uncharacterized protein LOC101858663 [Aplysia californica]
MGSKKKGRKKRHHKKVTTRHAPVEEPASENTCLRRASSGGASYVVVNDDSSSSSSGKMTECWAESETKRKDSGTECSRENECVDFPEEIANNEANSGTMRYDLGAECSIENELVDILKEIATKKVTSGTMKNDSGAECSRGNELVDFPEEMANNEANSGRMRDDLGAECSIENEWVDILKEIATKKANSGTMKNDSGAECWRENECIDFLKDMTENEVYSETTKKDSRAEFSGEKESVDFAANIMTEEGVNNETLRKDSGAECSRANECVESLEELAEYEVTSETPRKGSGLESSRENTKITYSDVYGEDRYDEEEEIERKFGKTVYRKSEIDHRKDEVDIMASPCLSPPFGDRRWVQHKRWAPRKVITATRGPGVQEDLAVLGAKLDALHFARERRERQKRIVVGKRQENERKTDTAGGPVGAEEGGDSLDEQPIDMRKGHYVDEGRKGNKGKEFKREEKKRKQTKMVEFTGEEITNKVCVCCGKRGVMLPCSHCLWAGYCGQRCQQQDHQDHEKSCKNTMKFGAALREYLLDRPEVEIPGCYSLCDLNRLSSVVVSPGAVISKHVIAEIVCPHQHSFRPSVVIQDIHGAITFMVFYSDTEMYTSTEPTYPHLQPEVPVVPLKDCLVPGNFVVIHRPSWHYFSDTTVGFRIDNLTDVHFITR